MGHQNISTKRVIRECVSSCPSYIQNPKVYEEDPSTSFVRIYNCEGLYPYLQMLSKA